MKHRVSVLNILMAVLVALALLVPGAAMAVGTLAGTTVSNDATVDYKVGGISQPTITSAATTFTVDAKVNFALTDLIGIGNTVTPAGATDTYYLSYRVTNDSNVGLDLGFVTAQNVGDDWDQPLLAGVFIDSNGNDIYDTGVDTATFVDELEVGFTNTIFVVADTISSPLADGDISNITLTATAYYNGAAGQGALIVDDAASGSPGDDNSGPGSMDWVLADDGASGDGIEALDAAFLVSTATLTITKTSALLWDPINLFTNPIAIPGATISYTIQVSNAAGGAIATEITITDTMPAEMTYSSDGITVINGGGAGGGTFGLSNAQGGCPEFGSACGWYDGTDTVIVNGITLDANQNTQMIFNATID